MRLVTLTKDHTQNGVKSYAGQTIELDDETADWLLGVQVEEKVASRTVVEVEATVEVDALRDTATPTETQAPDMQEVL